MNNELEHHGILGMKWGVRRYQNEDGSLTAAGKKRYNTMQDASSYARQKGDFWKNSYEDAKKDMKKYEEKYSGEEGVKRYKKDMFDDDEMTDEDARQAIKADMKWLKMDAESMNSLAKDWYSKADAFQSHTVDDIPSKLYNEGKKYAKEWQKGR